MDPVLDFAIQLARQAGEFLSGRFFASDNAASLKPDRSVVTQADVAADRMIYDAIRAAYPDDLYLSEELHPELNALPGDAIPPMWVVDPLDGTTNFSLGLPIWGVLICRLVAGLPEVAVLYFPMLDELYTAQRGRGAYRNGEKLILPVADNGRPISFFACCSRTFRHYQVNIPFKPRILGSAAYNVCCVARSIAILSFDASPKIWDIAGAWLLLNEAGGCIQTYDGSRPFPVKTGQAYQQKDFPVLAGISAEVVDRWRQEIQPKNK
jgi:myo-inositol-1(or 4)-monophosphatase